MLYTIAPELAHWKEAPSGAEMIAKTYSYPNQSANKTLVQFEAEALAKTINTTVGTPIAVPTKNQNPLQGQESTWWVVVSDISSFKNHYPKIAIKSGLKM